MVIEFEGAQYQFSFDDLDVLHARTIKSQAGLTIKQLMEGLSDLDVDAIVALYWLVLAQNGKITDMHKLNFKVFEFAAAFDKAAEAEIEANPTKPAQRKAPRTQT